MVNALNYALDDGTEMPLIVIISYDVKINSSINEKNTRELSEFTFLTKQIVEVYPSKYLAKAMSRQ